MVKNVPIGAGGLRFDSRAGQIEHGVANIWPPLRCFYNNYGCFEIILNRTVIEGDCEMSLRSCSQQPPGVHVKCNRPQP